jgi:hypothetical protein
LVYALGAKIPMWYEYQYIYRIYRKLRTRSDITNMNICESEIPMSISARTCSCKDENGKKIAYAFVDSYHGLCLDKMEIIKSELEACLTLLKYSSNDMDLLSIVKEIAQLRIMLDFLT